MQAPGYSFFMASLADFRTRFPEFQNVPDSAVAGHLAGAALEIDLLMWGAKADEGHCYLAAHKLVLSPWGQGARTAKEGVYLKGQTLYWQEYSRLMRMVATGPRVL